MRLGCLSVSEVPISKEDLFLGFLALNDLTEGIKSHLSDAGKLF